MKDGKHEKKRTKLQEISSNHTWARNQIKGFHAIVTKSWPNNEVKVGSATLILIQGALKELERDVKESYSLYKKYGRN